MTHCSGLREMTHCSVVLKEMTQHSVVLREMKACYYCFARFSCL